jgi:methylenetetrahydrofolate dehydrogenase (NADP+)/methenyltetrahydrofolate cyclohydrolase
MTAKILSGKEFADDIKKEVAAQVAELVEVHRIMPTLVVVRVGEDPASAVYVGNKVRTAQELGIRSEHIHFDDDVSAGKVAETVRQLNAREDVDGILVQLPLPRRIDEREIVELIDPEKDVDGFHPINIGRLLQGYEALTPCTPAGVIEVLKRAGIEIEGSRAVVVGRSNIVGKPLSALLLKENATVTICHSRTKDLAAVTREADILIAAIGRAGFIRVEHIREGAAVIDVGINSVETSDEVRELFAGNELQRRLETLDRRGSTLVGDVCPRDAQEKAGAITPVPGGIGLLTVAMLMKNTITAAKMRRGIM